MVTMETYLTLLYVTLEQEIAVKEFFASKGWMYFKPDLNVMTERIGPSDIPTAQTRNSNNYSNSARAKSGTSQTVNKYSKHSVVVTDIDDSRVKIEVSGDVDDADDIGDDVDERFMEDDGDNDDDFADNIDDSLEDFTTIDEYTSSEAAPVAPDVNILKNADLKANDTNKTGGGTGTCLVGVEKRESGDSTEIGADGQQQNKSVIDKKYIQSIVLSALKSSMSGKESTKDDFCECPRCEKAVKNTSIRRHLLSHLNLPYKCGRCTMYFNSASELETHKENKHMGEYVCGYCGVKYRHRNSLNEHVQKQHERTAKLFECEICGVQMHRQRHLEDHMNIHKNVNPYTCSKCEKSYKNKCAFKRHSKTCGSNVKHACEVCGQLYTTELGLRDHKKRCHEGRYDFRCVCEAVFKTRSARCRHRLLCDAYKSSLDQSNAVVVQNNLHTDNASVGASNVHVPVETDLANSMNIDTDNKNQAIADMENNVTEDINSECDYESQHVHVDSYHGNNLHGEFIQ